MNRRRTRPTGTATAAPRALQPTANTSPPATTAAPTTDPVTVPPRAYPAAREAERHDPTTRLPHEAGQALAPRADDDDDRVVAEIDLGERDVAVHVETDDDKTCLLETFQGAGEVPCQRDRTPGGCSGRGLPRARVHAVRPALGPDDPVTAVRRD